MVGVGRSTSSLRPCFGLQADDVTGHTHLNSANNIRCSTDGLLLSLLLPHPWLLSVLSVLGVLGVLRVPWGTCVTEGAAVPWMLWILVLLRALGGIEGIVVIQGTGVLPVLQVLQVLAILWVWRCFRYWGYRSYQGSSQTPKACTVPSGSNQVQILQLLPDPVRSTHHPPPTTRVCL